MMKQYKVLIWSMTTFVISILVQKLQLTFLTNARLNKNSILDIFWLEVNKWHQLFETLLGCCYICGTEHRHHILDVNVWRSMC